MLKMFDLAGADSARRFRPYCWRMRRALAHMGLEVETIPWRFTEKAALAPAGRAMSRHYSSLGDVPIGSVAPFVVHDMYEHIDVADKAYFRASREKRFGKSLEDVVAGREARLPAFRDSLTAMRVTLKHQPFFGGTSPLYADYALFGAFQWARCVSPFQLLAADDPVAQSRGRLPDAFDGLARKAPGYDA